MNENRQTDSKINIQNSNGSFNQSELPKIPQMLFIPPPINNFSVYTNYKQSSIKRVIGEQKSTIQQFQIFGQNRSISLDNVQPKLLETLFIDNIQKQKMKKIVKNIYEKMIQNLKQCSGQVSGNPNPNFNKIKQKSDELRNICLQVKVAETKIKIWQLIQQQTNKLNRKSQAIQNLLQSLNQHCINQQIRQIQE